MFTSSRPIDFGSAKATPKLSLMSTMRNPQFGCLLGPEAFILCWFIWEIPDQKLLSTGLSGPLEKCLEVFPYKARHRTLIDPGYSIFKILFIFSFDLVHLKILLILC
jgi:hypothetical protein